MNPRSESAAGAAAPTAASRRRQLLILLAIFVAPVLMSYTVYFLLPGLRPTGTTNYGTLVRPARPLPALALRDAGGQARSAAAFQGKWSLIYVGGAGCDQACRSQVYLSRQVRTALGHDAERVQRVYLAPDLQSLATARSTLGADHPDLLLFADEAHGDNRAGQFFSKAPAGALLLVDPLGNWMMVYPPQADPVADFKGILKDMKKLLRQSQVD